MSRRLEQIASCRDALLKDYPDMASRATAIRESAVANLPALAEKAKQSLTGKKCIVYQAKDKAEAATILRSILQNQEQVVRTYSKTLREIGFDELMSAQGTVVNLSRIEEIVWAGQGSPFLGHPRLPQWDLSPQEIKAALRKFVSFQGEVSPQRLKEIVYRRIKEDILRCGYGITSADSVVAENGVLVLPEDEGDGRAVSNLPYHHVAVAGLDKLTWLAEDAVTLAQTTAVYGMGRNTPNYCSLIAGPSRTADIEFRMAYGMHGPKEVHVILLDNGRSALRDQGLGGLLKCIDCGSCYSECAALAAKCKWSEVVLTPKGMALGLVQGRLAPLSSALAMSDFVCPVGLDAKGVVDMLTQVKC
jgi:L-lactate utilization protein LutB